MRGGDHVETWTRSGGIITNHREQSERHLDMTAPVLERHIEITSGVAGSKPRIAGHRVTVQTSSFGTRVWAEARMRSAPYDLTLADVYAALAYYFDHQEEIYRSLEASDAFVTELRERNPSFLERKLKAIRGD